MGTGTWWVRTAVTVVAIGPLAMACGDDARDSVDSGLVIDARAGADSGATDGAPGDAPVPDAAGPDAAVPDAASPDAAVPDAASPDAAIALLVVEPATVYYGSVPAGGWMEGCPPPPVQTLLVTNLGGATSAPLTSTLVGIDASDFAIETDDCAGVSLAPASSCAVTVVFRPWTTGSKSATLSVTGAPGEVGTAALTGTGITDGGAWLEVLPTFKWFDDTAVSSASTGTVFLVSNPSACTTGLIAVAIVGSDPSDFPVTADACSGTSLTAGGSCEITVQFAPTAPGSRSATMEVSASPGGLLAAPLAGTGL